MTIGSFCLCFILANIITGVAFAIDDYKECKKEKKNESKRNKDK